VLRRVFGPKREEMTGGWRRLHNEELRKLYASPNIIRVIKSRRMKWVDHVVTHDREGERNAYKILVGKPEGERPCERLKRRSEDNIRMDLRQIRWEVVDWMRVTGNRDQCRALVNTVMNLRFPYKAGNFLTS
jgi:hypothetical protein